MTGNVKAVDRRHAAAVDAADAALKPADHLPAGEPTELADTALLGRLAFAVVELLDLHARQHPHPAKITDERPVTIVETIVQIGQPLSRDIPMAHGRDPAGPAHEQPSE